MSALRRSNCLSTRIRTRAVALILVCGCLAAAAGWTAPSPALAATGGVGAATAVGSGSAPSAGGEDNELESAASKAGETGRRVAMSLIALGFAFAAIVLAFRRDFKEAVGVFAVGVVAVLLAQETGVKLVKNLVVALFGS